MFPFIFCSENTLLHLNTDSFYALFILIFFMFPSLPLFLENFWLRYWNRSRLFAYDVYTKIDVRRSDNNVAKMPAAYR